MLQSGTARCLATALPGVLIFSQSCCQLALGNLASLLDHKAIVSLPSRPDSPATKSELLTQRINSSECVTCGHVPPATSWLLQRFMTYTAELATCSHVSPEHDIVQQGFSFIDMTRLLLCATGSGLLTDVAGNLKSGNCSESLDGWLSGMLHPNRNPDQSLAVHIKLLLACNSALELVKVTGCEATLHSLASSWLAASDGTDAGSPEVAAAAAPSDQQTDTAPNTAVWHALSANLLADLAETTCQLPLALQALKIGSGSAEIGFPKFQKLIGFLKGMIQEKSAWHGMIFVKTRQGVHELVSLLRKTPAVAEHVAFHAFTGHAAGKSTSGNPAWTSHLNTLHRMKVKDQAAILHSFKNGQGRQVLNRSATGVQQQQQKRVWTFPHASLCCATLLWKLAGSGRSVKAEPACSRVSLCTCWSKGLLMRLSWSSQNNKQRTNMLPCCTPAAL